MDPWMELVVAMKEEKSHITRIVYSVVQGKGLYDKDQGLPDVNWMAPGPLIAPLFFVKVR